MKKILVCCNAGMSTSMLVAKIDKEIAARGIEVAIEARPLAEAQENLDGVDILLLGPQVGYAQADLERELAGRIPVEVIPMADYGRMAAAKILDDALAKMGA